MPWTGYRIEEIDCSRLARIGATTSWSSLKLWRYALDGIFSFTVKPLKVWGVIGVLISFLSFVYAGLIVLRALAFGVDLPGFASLIVAVLFLGGDLADRHRRAGRIHRSDLHRCEMTAALLC